MKNRSAVDYSLLVCVSSKVVKRKPRRSLKQLAQMDSGEDLLGMETNEKNTILDVCFCLSCNSFFS